MHGVYNDVSQACKLTAVHCGAGRWFVRLDALTSEVRKKVTVAVVGGANGAELRTEGQSRCKMEQLKSETKVDRRSTERRAREALTGNREDGVRLIGVQAYEPSRME